MGEIDGVRPVADGGEEGEIADEAGTLEFHGAEEEESGEGAVEERAPPGLVGNCDRVVAEDDGDEQKNRGGKESDACRGMQPGTAVDLEERVSGEELQDGGV